MKARALNIKKAPVPQADKVEVFDDVEQGSEPWHELRRGLPTASNFGTIMASGVGGGESLGRAKLLRTLAGEILTGEVAETYSNAAMNRGKEMEPEACDYYGRTRFASMTKVGFVRRTVMPRGNLGDPFVVGASPDRLIDKDGALETKTMRPDMLIEVALKGASGFPSEHRPQCQGILWVTGRAWCDLAIFYRGMPVSPTFRIVRDDAYIAKIRDAVEAFNWELHQLVDKIRKMGRQ